MLVFLIGLGAGLFGGLVGLGGGAIMIPAMVGILKLSQHEAHGTSLVALVFTGLAGAGTYALHGSVDVLASLLLASTAIFTSGVGARFANTLPEWKLKRSFGWFLMGISAFLLLKPFLPHAHGMVHGWPQIVALLLTGAFTGFLSGMMGVGGGGIMVASMVLLLGFPQYTAQGCSLLAMIPIGAAGALTHWRLGNVRKNVLPALLPGILLGSFLGGSLAHVLPKMDLRIVFVTAILFMGAKYLRTSKPRAEPAQ